MVLAISIVLSYISIQVSPSLRIGVAFLATAMLGMLFGPVLGGVVAGLGDVIKFFLKPTGPFFPGFTITALLGGVIYGMFFYKNKVTLSRCVFAKLCVNVLLNIVLNTFWNSILMGKAFWALLVPRVWKNIVLLPVEITLLYVVLRTVSIVMPRINRRYTQIPRAKRKKKVNP